MNNIVLSTQLTAGYDFGNVPMENLAIMFDDDLELKWTQFPWMLRNLVDYDNSPRGIQERFNRGAIANYVILNRPLFANIDAAVTTYETVSMTYDLVESYFQIDGREIQGNHVALQKRIEQNALSVTHSISKQEDKKIIDTIEKERKTVGSKLAVSFVNGGNLIPVDYHFNSNITTPSGLTTDKITKLNTLLSNRGMGPISTYGGINSRVGSPNLLTDADIQTSFMLKDDRFYNSQFTSQRFLETGAINNMLGLNWVILPNHPEHGGVEVPKEQITFNNNGSNVVLNIRNLYAFPPAAIKLRVQEPGFQTITQLITSNNSIRNGGSLWEGCMVAYPEYVYCIQVALKQDNPGIDVD